MRTSAAAIAIALLALAACSGEDRNAASKSRLFDSQRQALEKSKGVSETVRQNEAAQRSQTEEQSK